MTNSGKIEIDNLNFTDNFCSFILTNDNITIKNSIFYSNRLFSPMISFENQIEKKIEIYFYNLNFTKNFISDNYPFICINNSKEIKSNLEIHKIVSIFNEGQGNFISIFHISKIKIENFSFFNSFLTIIKIFYSKNILIENCSFLNTSFENNDNLIVISWNKLSKYTIDVDFKDKILDQQNIYLSMKNILFNNTVLLQKSNHYNPLSIIYLDFAGLATFDNIIFLENELKFNNSYFPFSSKTIYVSNNIKKFELNNSIFEKGFSSLKKVEIFCLADNLIIHNTSFNLNNFNNKGYNIDEKICLIYLSSSFIFSKLNFTHNFIKLGSLIEFIQALKIQNQTGKIESSNFISNKFDISLIVIKIYKKSSFLLNISNCNFSLNLENILKYDSSSISSKIEFNNCQFLNNLAKIGGVAIIFSDNVKLFFKNCYFFKNIAKMHGNLYINGTSEVFFKNSNVSTFENCSFFYGSFVKIYFEKVIFLKDVSNYTLINIKNSDFTLKNSSFENNSKRQLILAENCFSIIIVNIIISNFEYHSYVFIFDFVEKVNIEHFGISNSKIGSIFKLNHNKKFNLLKSTFKSLKFTCFNENCFIFSNKSSISFELLNIFHCRKFKKEIFYALILSSSLLIKNSKFEEIDYLFSLTNCSFIELERVEIERILILFQINNTKYLSLQTVTIINSKKLFLINNLKNFSIKNSIFRNNFDILLKKSPYNSIYSESINIFKSNFDSNTGIYGGALSLENYCNLLINLCIFQSNKAIESGGALNLICNSFLNCKWQLENNEFDNNHANKGGGSIKWENHNFPLILSETNNIKNSKSNYWGQKLASNPYYFSLDYKIINKILKNEQNPPLLRKVKDNTYILSNVPTGKKLSFPILISLQDYYDHNINFTGSLYVAVLFKLIKNTNNNHGEEKKFYIQNDTFHEGFFRFENIIFEELPNSSNDFFVKITGNDLYSQNEFSWTIKITISFKDCQIGESFENFTCKICPSGSYSLK